MTDHSDIISSVRKSAAKRIIYLPHAVRQMSRPDRMISVAEVRNVVERGELVEDYLKMCVDTVVSFWVMGWMVLQSMWFAHPKVIISLSSLHIFPA